MDSLPLPVHTASEVEEADFRQVVNPTSTTVLPQNSTRGEAIRHFSRAIPTNDFGLPLYYLRSDLLDWHSILGLGHADTDTVEAAAEILSYEEGYPCLPSGSPWWAQLAHEAFPDHQLFKCYLDLAETDGIRLLDTLARQQQVALERVRELSLEYYWAARAQAYDLFVVAAEAKRREARTRKTEAHHFDTASALLDTVVARINSEPDLIKQMSASDLIETMEKMIKIQRLSLGLTGAQASTNGQLPMQPGASVEVTLRQLTKDVGLTGQAQENFGDRLKLLMGDEKTALVAQELVIRANTNNLVSSNTGASS